MKKNPDEEGRIVDHSKGVGTVNREMVLQRAREIAVINGRQPTQVIDSDFDQARRELTGEGEISPREKLIESLPETERWDPVPGTPGRQAPKSPIDDEQEVNEKLVEEGVEDAEHDQMLEGAKEEERRNKT